MDAIELLKDQHERIAELFLRCDGAPPEERREVFLKLARALTLHSQLEEEQFYVAMKRADTVSFLADSENEHAEVRALISQLAKTPVNSRQFQALLVDLRACVDAHVAEEENVFFPLAYRTLGREGLAVLGEAMEDRALELSRPDGLPTFVSPVPEMVM